MYKQTFHQKWMSSTETNDGKYGISFLEINCVKFITKYRLELKYVTENTAPCEFIDNGKD